MDIFPKFIIEDGILILSKVTYHNELVEDEEKVQGGGWFRYDSDNKTFILNGSSHEYGTARIEDIKKAIKDDKVYTGVYAGNSIAKEFKFVYYEQCGEIIQLN